ncbi:MAG: phage tail protein [Deltaproteobacteria bacterium]|nr:phage tail protein [Deltaproteobacteria bacterium]
MSEPFSSHNTTSLFTVSITSTDDKSKSVTAQYNPKEVGINKSVPWQKHKDSKSDQPQLEFSGADGRSLDLELTFDGYEDKINVHDEYVNKLIEMTMAQVDASDKKGKEDQKRPHMIVLTWGAGSKLPKFEGVIESVNTKYTMFLNDGTPVRATCTVKLKEASKASFKKKA